MSANIRTITYYTGVRKSKNIDLYGVSCRERDGRKRKRGMKAKRYTVYVHWREEGKGERFWRDECSWFILFHFIIIILTDKTKERERRSIERNICREKKVDGSCHVKEFRKKEREKKGRCLANKKILLVHINGETTLYKK